MSIRFNKSKTNFPKKKTKKNEGDPKTQNPFSWEIAGNFFEGAQPAVTISTTRQGAHCPTMIARQVVTDESWIEVGKRGRSKFPARQIAYCKTANDRAARFAKAAAASAIKVAGQAEAQILKVCAAALLQKLKLYGKTIGHRLKPELWFTDCLTWQTNGHSQNENFARFVAAGDQDLWVGLGRLTSLDCPSVDLVVQSTGETSPLALHVENMTGQSTSFEMKKGPGQALVWDLKKKIEQVWGHAVESQNLWHQPNDDPLQNDRTLDSYGIVGEANLILVVESFEEQIRAIVQRWTEPNSMEGPAPRYGKCYDETPCLKSTEDNYFENEWRNECDGCHSCCGLGKHGTAISEWDLWAYKNHDHEYVFAKAAVNGWRTIRSKH
jgi:hypothetical protein